MYIHTRVCTLKLLLAFIMHSVYILDLKIFLGAAIKTVNYYWGQMPSPSPLKETLLVACIHMYVEISEMVICMFIITYDGE